MEAELLHPSRSPQSHVLNTHALHLNKELKAINYFTKPISPKITPGSSQVARLINCFTGTLWPGMKGFPLIKLQNQVVN